MGCVICKHGELVPGTITYTHHAHGTTLVLKQVPALLCDNCGEEYLDDSTVESIELILKANETTDKELVVADYHTAA